MYKCKCMQVSSNQVICMEVHQRPGMGDLHICEGTIDAEAYVGVFERHMLPSR